MDKIPPIYKYSDVKANKVNWLWYPYIPYGKITLLQGDPGEGKSTFIIQLIALLTKGKKLPDGTKGKAPINVIYQCYEDDPSDTIKPRLIKAGADCNRVMFFSAKENLTLDDQRLDEVLKKSKCRLIVFDPMQAFMSPNVDMSNAAQMRSVMQKLSAIASRRNCAVILVGHLNKGNTGKDLYRLLGSIDLPAIARSVLLVSRDEDDNDLRYMTQIKNNLAYVGPTVCFRLSEKGFNWCGIIARKVEKETNNSVTARPLDRAMTAIETLLVSGCAKGNDIINHLDSMGISLRTTRRAAKKLGIVTFRKNNAYYWKLPESPKEAEHGKND